MSHGRRGPGRFMLEKAQRTRPTKQLLGRLWGYLRKFQQKNLNLSKIN